MNNYEKNFFGAGNLNNKQPSQPRLQSATNIRPLS